MAPVVVVGGGLAGIAAAVALADAGRRVCLVEKRATLGGRAGSFVGRGATEPLDSSQHVLMGCCTNQRDLYRRLGIAHHIAWHDRLVLRAADGNAGVFRSCALPPPLHLLPGLLALPGLTVRDRLLLATAFGRMAFAARRRERLDHLTFAQWLGRTTSPTLDRGFWRLMLTSVLNADADQASAAAGLMFFLDGLMRHRDAFTLGVPRVPLSVLHHDAVLAHLAKQDAEVRLRATARVVPTAAGPRVWIDGAETSASAAVVAVRWTQLGRVLPRAAARALAAPAVERLRGEAIVGLHLWFAEPVTSAPVTGLLAQDVDWVFASEGGRRLSVVVSAAEGWRGLSRVALVERCLTALRRLWPDLPAPLRAVACREGEATFVPAPGLAALRPAQRTPWPGVALAGAWTRTGWPATQEGAVRSGYLAAEALLGQPVLAPDLPAQGLLRLVGPTC